MPTHTSMLYIRVDDRIKVQAADVLAGVGLKLSDAVRILLARVATEGGLPAGLTMDQEAHAAWSRAKVREAADDRRTPVCHGQAMDRAQALIDRAVPEPEWKSEAADFGSVGWKSSEQV